MARSKVISLADFKREQRESSASSRKEQRTATRRAFFATETGNAITVLSVTTLVVGTWAFFHDELRAVTWLGWLAVWAVIVLCVAGVMSNFWSASKRATVLSLGVLAGGCYVLPAILPFGIAFGIAFVVMLVLSP